MDHMYAGTGLGMILLLLLRLGFPVLERWMKRHIAIEPRKGRRRREQRPRRR